MNEKPSAADIARNELVMLALQTQERALDAHTEGMSLLRRATRIEQLAAICTDEQVLKLRDQLLNVDFDTQDFEVTGPGGVA